MTSAIAKPPGPPPMKLTVSFDVNQVRDRVNWNFCDTRATTEDPLRGDWHNDIRFQPGQTFQIELHVYGLQHPLQADLEGVHVVDCCLITLPQIKECGHDRHTKYHSPSPFAPATYGPSTPRGALVSIPGQDFSKTDSVSDTIFNDPSYGAEIPLVLRWNNTLTVGNELAHWDLSFYVTIELKRKKNGRHYRVFYFDPESEVTTGLDPP